MIFKPAVHLGARRRGQASHWEMALRYAAATAATLLAIAGAQLVVANAFIFALICLTLLGVPVSIYLRLSDMRIGSMRLSRPLWNSLTVLAASVATSYLLFMEIGEMLLPLFRGEVRQEFWIRFGPEDFLGLLMRAFLLFAAFRSSALISDKDATLCTVPSFSVLLLLIPAHKGIEVVFYFLAWAIVAAILFALDHRSELRASATAYVPPARPGQDVRLGARSLASVLAISLFAAATISYFLTARDVAERSKSEIAITDLAARLTKFALSIPELSSNSGPDRQIDFSASPTLPTRAELWQVSTRTLGGGRISPMYWRMLTLNRYDGSSWSQGFERTRRLARTELDRTIFPSLRAFRRDDEFSFDRSRAFNSEDLPQGFIVADALSEANFEASGHQVVVRQDITAVMPTIGFLPVLPAVRAIQVNDGRQTIRVRGDGAINLGPLKTGEWLRAISDVPAVPEYGFSDYQAPVRVLSAKAIAASRLALTPVQLKHALQLPTTLPIRVRALGRDMLRNSTIEESNYRRAQRLAVAIQQNATYTLHPPRVPEGRDATEWFLFEGGRRGYCTYFAGALTVLCRSQGIPARLVSGFINTGDLTRNTVVFRAANAHAWTEVWVDGWGWAVVDATPADDRGENSPSWIEAWQEWFSSGYTNLQNWVYTRFIIVVSLAALLARVVATKTSASQTMRERFLRAPVSDDVERRLVIETYRRMSRRMSRRFRPRSSWETPDEWLQHAAASLSPSDTESVRRLTALYTTATYAQRPLPSGSAALARRTAAAIAWKKIRSPK